MNARKIARAAAIAALAVLPGLPTILSGQAGQAGRRRVDVDLTRMNAVMRQAHAYRIMSGKFSGKTIRVSGLFLTIVEGKSGKRHFGCMVDGAGGCACCTPGGVLEFEPVDASSWPTNFPAVESRIVVSGKLKMVDIAGNGTFTVPCLGDAEIESPRPGR